MSPSGERYQCQSSGRIECGTKRTYEGMQSRQSGTGKPGKTGKPRKKFKFTAQEPSGMSSISGSYLPRVTTREVTITAATGQPIDGATAVEAARNPTGNSDPPTSAPIAIHESTDNAAPASPSVTAHSLDLPQSDGPADVAAVEIAAVSSRDGSSNLPAPQGEAPPVEPSATDCIEMTPTSQPPNEHTNGKRPVLDESGNALESVLAALKAQNTDRVANSLVSDKYSELSFDAIAFAKIISGIAVNCVASIFASLASALEIEKRRLQEYERNQLGQIMEGRVQMSLYAAARSRREEEYRQEEARLPKETEVVIARLTMREIADRDLKDVLSVPTELMGEFKEEGELDDLIREIDEEKASKVAKRERAAVKETYYWPIIQRLANTVGPLLGPRGKKTELTPQEKQTARRIVIALGYGHSRDSVLKARSYLKLLADLREAGVTLLLLYRTKEFRTHFMRHPNELETILSWNQVYQPRLQELRLRAIAQADGDFSGRCDLEDQDIFGRLHIPQGVTWGDELCDWRDTAEKDNYLAAHSIKAVSGKSNAHVLHHGIKGDIDANKAIYISMIPYEGISAKKTLGGKSPSAKLLAISPLVSVFPGDFLGIFPGRLRYTDEKPAGAIQGPAQGLWLDRSEVKGKLQWMKIAKAGEQTNVCLVWEGVNEEKGKKAFCQYWRILVIATRHIGPFDQVIRPA
jgi:hypothetical protein